VGTTSLFDDLICTLIHLLDVKEFLYWSTTRGVAFYRPDGMYLQRRENGKFSWASIQSRSEDFGSAQRFIVKPIANEDECYRLYHPASQKYFFSHGATVRVEFVEASANKIRFRVESAVAGAASSPNILKYLLTWEPHP
jgi:hypothetical protein